MGDGMDGSTMDGRMYGWIMVGWMDGKIDGWIDG